jgi:deazaflavin-dependent oxidoreductase (nitroreductase family)
MSRNVAGVDFSPSGLAARALQTRALARAPITLYRHGLGWVFGRRVLMLEHTGRRSGQARFVCLEVVDRPAPERVVVVVSGFGERADWYRNLRADHACFVSTGRLRRVPARARFMTSVESSATLDGYQRAHPRAWDRLRSAIEKAAGHTVDQLPMVELLLDLAPHRSGPSPERLASRGSTAVLLTIR